MSGETTSRGSYARRDLRATSRPVGGPGAGGKGRGGVQSSMLLVGTITGVIKEGIHIVPMPVSGALQLEPSCPPSGQVLPATGRELHRLANSLIDVLLYRYYIPFGTWDEHGERKRTKEEEKHRWPMHAFSMTGGVTSLLDPL